MFTCFGLITCMSLFLSCKRTIKVIPNSFMPFTLEAVEGHATLDTPRSTMVFEGETYENRSSGELQIAGESETTEVTAGELTGKYADGVCTVTFRNHTLTL